MFAKLLKHEWKSTSKLLGILSLCALGGGLVGAGALRAIFYFSTKAVNDSAAVLLIVGFAFLLFGLYLALILYAAGTEFYLIYRFYKTRFTDQGYLTFTLPVSNRSIFLSSYVNTLAWTLIALLTVVAAVATAFFLGGIAAEQEFWEEFRYMFSVLGMPDGYFLINALGALASGAASIMILMASVTAGAVIAKKHKILAAIGIYYGQSMVMGILASVIQVVGTFAVMGSYGSMEDVMWITGLTYVLQIAWGVGAYFLSMHLINKKLNLP